MKTSDSGIAAIKGFEGLRLAAYSDAAGVETIGYGHTGGVKAGQTVSEAAAEALLIADLAQVEAYINALGLTLTQGQFDALADFCYNLGTGSFERSTLLKKIRGGAAATEIQREFRRWVYAGGKKLPGLVKRREWEARQWTAE